MRLAQPAALARRSALAKAAAENEYLEVPLCLMRFDSIVGGLIAKARSNAGDYDMKSFRGQRRMVFHRALCANPAGKYVSV